MKILITGAGGQVGRALVNSAPTDAHVRAFSHEHLDIADLEGVMRCVRRESPDVIVNAAAYVAADRAESEAELARRINADGPRHLAVAAREVGARLVHISTDYVFDGTSSVPYAPHAPTHPLSVYGRTKRAGEEAVLEILPDRSVIVRTAWVYAARGRNFVLTMLHLMSATGSIRVVADRVGTPTSATSLAHTLWEIVDRPTLRGIHHWTDAGMASWYDFAVAIAEEAALLGLLPPEISVTPISARDYPAPARRPAYSVLDKSSLASLGIEPVHWRKQLRQVLGELRNA
jgi:dTDP-4-dehydrorhamnose reductase